MMLSKMQPHTHQTENVEVEREAFFVTNTRKAEAPAEDKLSEKINPASGRVSTQKMMPGVIAKLQES